MSKTLKEINPDDDDNHGEHLAYIIYTSQKRREYWDIWMTFILIITCIFTPLNIAFDYNQENSTVEYVDYLIDFIYLIDILVIFNSAYYDEE